MNAVVWWALGLVAYGLGSTVVAVLIGRMIRYGIDGPRRPSC